MLRLNWHTRNGVVTVETDATPRPPPPPLTDEEKAALQNCKTPREWANTLSMIKHRRRACSPPLPHDWRSFAIDSGLMERVTGISVERAHAGDKPLDARFFRTKDETTADVHRRAAPIVRQPRERPSPATREEAADALRAALQENARAPSVATQLAVHQAQRDLAALADRVATPC